MMTPGAIGVDVSDHDVRAVAVDATGAVTERTAARGTGALDQLTGQLGAVQQIAAGVAGDAPGVAAVERALPGARVHLCSPGAAAITAETWIGAARGAREAICLWIGDRVFAGVMLAGQPWAGAHGLAGAAAWLALNPVERQDYRKLGSLAAEVSNAGIARRLSWRIQSGDQSAVLERAGSLQAITAAHVFDGARSGDGVATSVVRETARYIGMAIANLACTVDPEVVVLAGPLSLAGDLFLEPVRQECARRIPPALVPHLRLELSPLSTDGVAIGAARLAMTAAP